MTEQEKQTELLRKIEFNTRVSLYILSLLSGFLVGILS